MLAAWVPTREGENDLPLMGGCFCVSDEAILDEANAARVGVLSGGSVLDDV
jgi:hypothetical protein